MNGKILGDRLLEQRNQKWRSQDQYYKVIPQIDKYKL